MVEYIVRSVDYNGVALQEVTGELVRCRDCKHYNAGFECLIEGYGIERNKDWFCADAERRSECAYEERFANENNFCPNCGARMKVKARKMPKDVDPGKFGEKICNDFRNGIPLVVEGVKGEDNERAEAD